MPKLKRNTPVFRRLGASNHCSHEHQPEDYYATDPKAVTLLLALESFKGPILEPCCGEGHISKVLLENGFKVDSFDIVDRGFGKVQDFLTDEVSSWKGDIITNPPYKLANEFLNKALQIVPNGRKVAMFLKVQFLEGKQRKGFFKKYPPKKIWVSSSRLKCGMNGDFGGANSALAYAWFIWEKGYQGETTLDWFN